MENGTKWHSDSSCPPWQECVEIIDDVAATLSKLKDLGLERREGRTDPKTGLPKPAPEGMVFAVALGADPRGHRHPYHSRSTGGHTRRWSRRSRALGGCHACAAQTPRVWARSRELWC